MGRELTLLDKSQPLVLILSIVVGLLVAVYLPSLASLLWWLVPLGVFIVIYAIFTGIEWGELLLAFRNVKPTFIALAVNFIVIPPFAWLLGYMFLRSYPDVWVGLILYLVAPCMGWFLVFTNLARGNVPLGVTLLAWNTILMFATLPFYVYLLAGTVISIDILKVLESIGVFLVLPFLLGQATQRVIVGVKGRDYFIRSIKPSISLVNLFTLAAVIIAMFASQGGRLLENPLILLRLIPPALLFFSSILLLDLLIGKLANLPYSDTALVAFTTTARNSEVALAIAVPTFPNNPLVALTVAIGPAIELPTLAIILQILIWIRARWKPA